MSLVGPRPPLPREVAGYDVWHRRRLSMKPGITGLWQVGARREPDFDRWVETRSRLHRPLVAVARPQDHGPHDPGDAPGPLSGRQGVGSGPGTGEPAGSKVPVQYVRSDPKSLTDSRAIASRWSRRM